MNGPVYNSEYKHTYEPNPSINPDLTELVGPNYHVRSQHAYGHDFSKETLPKQTHGPVFSVERKHGYGADFSVRHRTASPCAGPVMNVERKHNYADQPQRSLRARSNTPTMEVKRGHQYQGERAIKSDLTSIVGPVYNSGKATQHKFTGGYVAPKARTDQVELVNKFFKRETNERTETVQTEKVENVTTRVESKVEFSAGEDRRKEAIGRRQEFLKQQEDLHMEVKTSEMKVSNVKTRQQLEEERETFFKNTVLRVQQEATMLSNRAKEEEQKRIEWLRTEEERMAREEILRQEAMVRAEEERRQKEAARQEELRRQKLEVAKQREEQERSRQARIQQAGGVEAAEVRA